MSRKVSRLLVLFGMLALLCPRSAEAQVIWDTGTPRPVEYDGQSTHLGFTSGDVGSGLTERWVAVPFRVEEDDIISGMDIWYYVPSGLEFETVKYIIWNRDELNAPTNGDQFAEGDLGLHEDVGDLHQFVDLNLEIPAGDYYLTVYGDGSGSPNALAWFTGGQQPDESLESDFIWRSVLFSIGGFQQFRTPLLQPGADMTDPKDIWNPCFTIYGGGVGDELVWDQAGNGNWNSTTQWDGGEAGAIPNKHSDVIITENIVTVNQDSTGRALTVFSGGLAISAGKTLTLSDGVSFAPNTTLTMGNDAHFATAAGLLPVVEAEGNLTIDVTGSRFTNLLSLAGYQNTGGAGSVLTKEGDGVLILDNRSGLAVSAPDTTFRVAEGHVIATGADPLGGVASIELAGGELAIGAPEIDYVAGLWFGELLGDSDTPINVTDVNPNTRVTVDLAETEGTIGPNTTQVFTGQIYDADGRIAFKEHIADNFLLWIDGELVLGDDNPTSETDSGELVLAPNPGLPEGWHDIEFRVSAGNDGGGVEGDLGLGFDATGGTAWTHVEDPGDASLLRAAVLGAIDVTGATISLTSDSVLNAATPLDASFGPLVIEEGVLTTTGTATSMQFAETTIAEGVTDVEWKTLVPTDFGTITALSAETTISKTGEGTWLLGSAPANSSNIATWKVVEGTLEVTGGEQLASRPVTLHGGTLLLKSSAQTPGQIDIPNTDVIVTADSILDVEVTAGGVATLGDLAIAANTTVTMGQAAPTFDNVTSAPGSAIEGPMAVRGVLSPGEGIGSLAVGGPLELVGNAATYLVEFDAAGAADLIEAQGEVTLGGVLELQGAGGMPTVGEYSATIMTSANNGIQGEFDTLPDGHLTHGVFFEGIRYNNSAVEVDLFQAEFGDTNGDRLVNIFDIFAIKVSPKGFGSGATDADWTDGDMVGANLSLPGDGIVNLMDIFAIKTAGQFGAGPYAGMSDMLAEDLTHSDNEGTATLIYDAATGELVLDNQAGIESLLIESSAELLVGTADATVASFVELDAGLFGAISFGGPILDGSLGAILPAGLEEATLMNDLSVADSDGATVNLVYQAVPEPATLALLAVACLGLAIARRRRAG